MVDSIDAMFIIYDLVVFVGVNFPFRLLSKVLIALKAIIALLVVATKFFIFVQYEFNSIFSILLLI